MKDNRRRLPQNIALIGFMGCGKSSIGRRLASAFNYQYLDTDILIEEKTGMSVTDYFSTNGEEAFRNLEHETIIGLEQQNGVVIATGGGAPLNPDNVISLRKHCSIIWLSASPEVTLRRVGDRNSRPLLRDSNDPLQTIIDMYQQREPIYRAAADKRIDTSIFQQIDTIRQIKRWLKDAGWHQANH
ncbi:MAG: shikimate kinase [Armatimonadota bacterium]